MDTLRQDIAAMVEELRAALREIGTENMPEANLVTDARDRLRYIASLTEQSAGQTLAAAERLAARLGARHEQALRLAGRTRSPEVAGFLRALAAEHPQIAADVGDIVQAQAFQDLVGQVINKLLLSVQHLEDNLAHLIVTDLPESDRLLAGPSLAPEACCSQADVDDLVG